MIENNQLETPAGTRSQKLADQSRQRFSRYAPPIIWATLIFIGSTDLLAASHTSWFLIGLLHWLFPRASDATLATIHFVIRKMGHFTEYAILALLAARAFRTSSRPWLRRGWFWISLVLVIGYALSDEFHQSFVPSRTASIYDSMIDSIGGLIGLTLVWLWQNRIKQNKIGPSAVKVSAAA